MKFGDPFAEIFCICGPAVWPVFMNVKHCTTWIIFLSLSVTNRFWCRWSSWCPRIYDRNCLVNLYEGNETRSLTSLAVTLAISCDGNYSTCTEEGIYSIMNHLSILHLFPKALWDDAREQNEVERNIDNMQKDATEIWGRSIWVFDRGQTMYYQK